jgi:predicted kinase
MARLSFDVELWRRGLPVALPPPEIHAEIERELRSRLLDLVVGGRDVVLDFSFHSRRQREEHRALLEPLGVVPETVYLATDRATVLQRIRDRRGAHPDDIVLTEELAARYFDHFEVPTEAEGPLTVVHPS